MQEIHSLETSDLVDMLATYAASYSRMLREGTSEKEFAKCSLTIKFIQAEIDSRKQKKANTDSSITLPSKYTQ